MVCRGTRPAACGGALALALGLAALPARVAGLGLGGAAAPGRWKPMDNVARITAVHHKTGTHLVDQLVSVWVKNFLWSPVDTILNWRGGLYWRTVNASSATMSPYRIVHVIRDPVQLVVSGYFYHMNKRFSGVATGPKELRSENLTRGLQLEARAELNSTLKDIQVTLQASSGDPQVLTLGLENFEAEFEKTVTCMYRFLLGPSPPAHLPPKLPGLVRQARFADKTLWNANPQMKAQASAQNSLVDRIVVNSEENVRDAMAMISASESPVWEAVQALRSEFGYLELQEGVFRRPLPQFCEASVPG